MTATNREFPPTQQGRRSHILSTKGSLPVPPFHDPERDYTEIKDERHSKSALLLFTQHRFTKKRLVIKILREYEDARYRLKTVEERQKCQLEALRWDRKFAPGVYIGLVPIHRHVSLQNSICIGKIIKNPSMEMLDPGVEYGLLMEELPESRRFDVLLKEENESVLCQHLLLLAQYMAYMHTKLVEPVFPNTENLQWGSFGQIQRKLALNLALLDLVLTINDNGPYGPSQWMTDNLSKMLPRNWYQHYAEHHMKRDHGNLDLEKLKAILDPLRYNLLQVLRPYPYQTYFEERIEKNFIKHCHGDLKAAHTWIMSYDGLSYGNLSKHVSVLDAIDFNPIFNNIDILSDLAMILIDIQVRTKSLDLTARLMEEYLGLTRQTDKTSRAVLNYYLVEKAITWAAVSIFFDDSPELGYALLKVAEMHINALEWKDLFRQDLIWRADTLLVPALLPSRSQSK